MTRIDFLVLCSMVTNSHTGNRCSPGAACAEEEGSQVLGALRNCSILLLPFPLPDTALHPYRRAVSDAQGISRGIYSQIRSLYYIFISDSLDSEGVCENISSWRLESGLYAEGLPPTPSCAQWKRYI